MADRATRADLEQVSAFLREVDRMLHPASRRAAGGYRVPPAVAEPLPPTGVPGLGDRAGDAGRSAPGWTQTRTAAPQPLPPPPAVPWVEPPQSVNLRAQVAPPVPDAPGERLAPVVM